MVTVIVKKHSYPNWRSYVEIKRFKHKFIKYQLYKWYFQSKGYEIEEVNE